MRIVVNQSGCAGIAYGHNGGLDGYETNVLVSGNGNRVAVLLLNGRTAGGSGDNTAFDTINRLYCRLPSRHEAGLARRPSSDGSGRDTDDALERAREGGLRAIAKPVCELADGRALVP